MQAADLGQVPDAEKTQSPVDLFLIIAGANLVATTLQTGASLAPAFGLRQAALLAAGGIVLGTALVAALTPLGPRLGVPSVVACRAALGLRGPAGDARGDAEPGPERRERRDERGPEDDSARGEEGRLPEAERGRKARSRLERRRDEVRPRDDEEKIDGRLRLLGVRDGTEIGGLHQASEPTRPVARPGNHLRRRGAGGSRSRAPPPNRRV